jgi:hypothetical protein
MFFLSPQVPSLISCSLPHQKRFDSDKHPFNPSDCFRQKFRRVLWFQLPTTKYEWRWSMKRLFCGLTDPRARNSSIYIAEMTTGMVVQNRAIVFKPGPDNCFFPHDIHFMQVNLGLLSRCQALSWWIFDWYSTCKWWYYTVHILYYDNWKGKFWYKRTMIMNESLGVVCIEKKEVWVATHVCFEESQMTTPSRHLSSW